MAAAEQLLSCRKWRAAQAFDERRRVGHRQAARLSAALAGRQFHGSRSSSCEAGCSAMRASTSASQACGSMLHILAVTIRLYMAAARVALRDRSRRTAKTCIRAIVLSRHNLGYWDRDPVSTWPQGRKGTILWCLSHTVSKWETPDRWVRSATSPVNGVLDAKDVLAGTAFELRTLRFFAFLGVLDARSHPVSTDRFFPAHVYRKTALFDRLLSLSGVGPSYCQSAADLDPSKLHACSQS